MEKHSRRSLMTRSTNEEVHHGTRRMVLLQEDLQGESHLLGVLCVHTDRKCQEQDTQ